MTSLRLTSNERLVGSSNLVGRGACNEDRARIAPRAHGAHPSPLKKPGAPRPSPWRDRGEIRQLLEEVIARCPSPGETAMPMLVPYDQPAVRQYRKWR